MTDHPPSTLTFSASNGLHVLLVIRDGKVIDGLIDQRDLDMPGDEPRDS